MLLAIDVGNTHTVVGVFQRDHILYNWRIKTDPANTADEIASLFYSLFRAKHLSFDQITGVIVACVVPPMELCMSHFSMKYLSLTPILVDDRIKTGIKILTDHPAEVGADRIVNTVAAYEMFKKAVIVVDFGTAITFDCVSDDGNYLGGVITPGLLMAIRSLSKETAKLPQVDISTSPKAAIGTNTIQAIKSGILFGYSGLIEGLIARIKKEFAPVVPVVIATGGMASLVAPYAPSIESVEPMLTLEGLRLLYEKNSK